MSHKNGNRSRFDRQRKAKMHNRTRIRELGKAMKDAGIAGDVGTATGYVLRFSNGLVAYLSGDTGIVADQERVVRDYYKAKLAVMNMGDGFTTGPAFSTRSNFKRHFGSQGPKRSACL